MAKKATRIFQEQANIEKILLKNISEYRPTGDEDFDALVRQHLMKDVHERSVGFILSLYDIAWDMTFGEWQDFWFDMGIRIFDAENEYEDEFCHTDFTDDTDDDDEFNTNYREWS